MSLKLTYFIISCTIDSYYIQYYFDFFLKEQLSQEIEGLLSNSETGITSHIELWTFSKSFISFLSYIYH